MKRQRRNGFKCLYRLCNNRVPNSSMWCSSACQQAAKQEQPAPTPSIAPPPVYLAGRIVNRKFGTDNRS